VTVYDGPAGKKLRPGTYVLRLTAYPTDDGPATKKALRVRVR